MEFTTTNAAAAIVITFMQGTDNYIPETNPVSGVHNVAANLWLQLKVHVMLFPF
jgi:hypothetical protein